MNEATAGTHRAIRWEVAGGVATVNLCDSRRGNPVDDRFCRELAEMADQLTNDPTVRSILIRANGDVFSVGGDLKSFECDQSAWPANIRRLTALLNTAVVQLQQGDAAVVAAVQGVCARGMVSLTAGCDYVIASPTARFVAAYAGIAFSCDVGASVVLPQRMGLARARRFLLFNETLAADAALATGLVDEVIEGADLHVRATAVAARLANGPTRSFGEIRRLMLSALHLTLEAQLAAEANALARMVATDDVAKGLAAFSARRQPHFKGG